VSTCAPDLSVVLPSYKGGAFVADTVRTLRHDLDELGLVWEALIVDDGSHDIELPDRLMGNNVRVIAFPENRGKGAAVRAGMLAGTGRVRAYTDIDLPFGTRPLIAAYSYIVENVFHAVVGDRTLPRSRYIHELSAQRRILSKAFSTFVGRVIAPGYFDTQCGFKAFRGDVADAIYGLSRVDRFAQDVEVVYLLLIHRLDVKRVPVVIERTHPSTLRLFRDASRMLYDVLAMQATRRRGRYSDSWLHSLVCEEYEARFSDASLSSAHPATHRTAERGE